MLIRKCLLAMLILMLVILMLILMLLNLNTCYADADPDSCIRIMSLCETDVFFREQASLLVRVMHVSYEIHLKLL